MKIETLAEYLARGGKITYCTPGAKSSFEEELSLIPIPKIRQRKRREQEFKTRIKRKKRNAKKRKG
jgi:hypothetical protein